MLQGSGTSAQTDVVAFNTALVLWAAGIQSDLESASGMALAALREGLAWQKLESLRTALSSG